MKVLGKFRFLKRDSSLRNRTQRSEVETFRRRHVSPSVRFARARSVHIAVDFIPSILISFVTSEFASLILKLLTLILSKNPLLFLNLALLHHSCG